MKLKTLLKVSVPLVGVAALSISLPLALTSCSDSTSENLSKETIQKNLQKEITKKSNFLYYFLSNESALKKLVCSSTNNQFKESNIKQITAKLDEQTETEEKTINNYKVSIEVVLNDSVQIDDENVNKILFNNLDTNIAKTESNSQTIVATNKENLNALAQYVQTLNNFNKIGKDNVEFGKSNSGKQQFAIKPGSEIFNNICYLLNINPDMVFQGKMNEKQQENTQAASGIRFISNTVKKDGNDQQSYSLFIILDNKYNWNKTELTLEHNGEGNSQADWYGEIKLDDNNTKKFVYQSSSNPDSVGYGKNNNAMGIYSFDIADVQFPTEESQQK